MAQRRSNSATFTGCRPTTRRDESPRPIAITMRPSEMSCIVAYQLAVIVGSRMPGLVTKCPSLIRLVSFAASGSVAYDSSQRMCESYVQAYSKPCRSASRISSIIRWYGGGRGGGTPHPGEGGPPAAPWWVWIGGALGAFYVAASIVTAPRLGAATLIALVVAGQAVASLLIDQFGWVGFH